MSDAMGRDKPQTRRRKSLSDKQLAILEVIQRSIARHGYPPSMREIGDAVGLKSLSSVTHQLNQLELSGYLRRDAGKTRAMEVLIDLPGAATENPADTAPAVGDAALVPLVGRIAAGVPISAIQEHSRDIAVPPEMLAGGEHFALEVKGDSMIDAGINEGDIIICKRCETAENGDIVVALVEKEEATLKRLRKKGASIALEAANPNYETRIFGPDQVDIQGRLVGLIRRF